MDFFIIIAFLVWLEFSFSFKFVRSLWNICIISGFGKLVKSLCNFFSKFFLFALLGLGVPPDSIYYTEIFLFVNSFMKNFFELVVTNSAGTAA